MAGHPPLGRAGQATLKKGDGDPAAAVVLGGLGPEIGQFRFRPPLGPGPWPPAGRGKAPDASKSAQPAWSISRWTVWQGSSAGRGRRAPAPGVHHSSKAAADQRFVCRGLQRGQSLGLGICCGGSGGEILRFFWPQAAVIAPS